jgi:hypothetical protein
MHPSTPTRRIRTGVLMLQLHPVDSIYVDKHTSLDTGEANDVGEQLHPLLH